MYIPAQNTEIERIYNYIWKHDYRSVVITSATPGEGVSTVAMALAQRNTLAGYSTVLVDLNLYRPCLKSVLQFDEGNSSDQNQLLNMPSLVSKDDDETTVLGVVAPTDRAAIIKLRKPGTLEACIQQWQETYDTVIIDATPVNRVNSQNIPTDRIASACDATFLVVRAGATMQAMAHEAAARLRDANANLAGCIINDQNNPSLKSELIRECKRLEPYLNKCSKALQRWILNNQFLCLDD